MSVNNFFSLKVTLHARIQEFSSGGGGGPGQSDKKSSLVLSLFYRSQLVNFKEGNWLISRFQRWSTIFQGGPTFSRGGGGSNCLFPIETHITCDFPGGGVRTPCPSLGSALVLKEQKIYILHGVTPYRFSYSLVGYPLKCK